MGRKGKREYIQVLRLMELFARDVVAAAVNDAIKLGAIGFDAVKQLTLARVERRAPLARSGAPIHICRRPTWRRRARPTTRLCSKEQRHDQDRATSRRFCSTHHLKALKLPTFLRRVREGRSRMRAPKASTIRAICCGSPSWS